MWEMEGRREGGKDPIKDGHTLDRINAVARAASMFTQEANVSVVEENRANIVFGDGLAEASPEIEDERSSNARFFSLALHLMHCALYQAVVDLKHFLASQELSKAFQKSPA